MLRLHGNRRTRAPHPSTDVITPNAGRFPTPTAYSPATDDVLISRVGWTDMLHPADHVAHRPDGGQPACPATTTGQWHRVAAGHARTMLASPCRERSCFPEGWPW